jgi:hypothetical protein
MNRQFMECHAMKSGHSHLLFRMLIVNLIVSNCHGTSSQYINYSWGCSYLVPIKVNFSRTVGGMSTWLVFHVSSTTMQQLPMMDKSIHGSSCRAIGN